MSKISRYWKSISSFTSLREGQSINDSEEFKKEEDKPEVKNKFMTEEMIFAEEKIRELSKLSLESLEDELENDSGTVGLIINCQKFHISALLTLIPLSSINDSAKQYLVAQLHHRESLFIFQILKDSFVDARHLVFIMLGARTYILSEDTFWWKLAYGFGAYAFSSITVFLIRIIWRYWHRRDWSEFSLT